jgi:hypothetical protein
MSTCLVQTPTSRVRFGHARVEITPPVGIYHRLWGAARHDRASGVHRPLVADVLVLAPRDGSAPAMVHVCTDLCGLADAPQQEIGAAIAEAVGVAPDRVQITHSHTHSSGWFVADRIPLPGGELIPAYLAELRRTLAEAGSQAAASVADATITYGTGRCNLAANRDYWDDQLGAHACGTNPDAPADDTVLVARVTDPAGRLRATLVNYACHPTTLAWDNSLISPDYIGAMREVVEAATTGPCVFAQGASGDVGPRYGFVGDTAVADRNGRQLGYAALSALTALGGPATDFGYDGPVVSGATLGAWSDRRQSPEHVAATERFAGGQSTVELPLKPRPDRAALQAELDAREAAKREADAAGNPAAARDAGAHAERARRWLARLADLPDGASYPHPYSVYRLGDAIWVTCGGEPYNQLQRDLRQQFPDRPILVSPLDGALQVAYLLPRERYGQGLYQEEPSILAPGCLERLTGAISARIQELT